MIEIQNVSFEYEKSQGTLSHIDLNIQQGECIVLTGESGCGKTTITKLINGLIPHFVEGGTLSGTTIVNGMNVAQTEMYRLAEQVGSVFQNPKSQFFNIDSDSEITFGLDGLQRRTNACLKISLHSVTIVLSILPKRIHH